MTQYIIYEQPNGIVAIIVPVDPIEDVVAKDVPQGVDYEIVDGAVIPTDRIFRNAWVKGKGAVDVDMVKARDIHMERIRVARDRQLTKLDVDYARADERNDGPLKVQIAQQKQGLRDLPQTLDLSAATTPEQLVAIWPQELG